MLKRLRYWESDRLLAYLERNLTKVERRKVARYMSQLNNLESIINSKKMSLFPSKTSTIKPDSVQESNGNNSDSDKYITMRIEVDDLELAKRRMDEIYKNAKPLHKLIWDFHFIAGEPDFKIYYDPENGVSKKTYYREKTELMNVVAECLNIDTI